ncbi:MAG: hypothetical protein A3H28_09750 [Acidobacteria bacterium RIFCSPLOWO2_02_FULL_61_28]|nr:MAG: hypothetical protein A3H28_09750 [Acidobacteria bacterium RIFCSPLOWO2_02_FULL_61_28]
MSDPFRVGPELHTVPGALPPAINVLPFQGNENEAVDREGAVAQPPTTAEPKRPSARRSDCFTASSAVSLSFDF